MVKMLKIVKYPAPILKKQAKEVKHLASQDMELLLAMPEAMQKYEGVGLAAPQVGVSKQIICVEEQKGAMVFLNPKIVKKSKEIEADEEGCLSLPGLFLSIKRAKKVRITCYTKEGKPIVLEAQGLAARIFQHEIDHLQGKLIIDKISPFKRLTIAKQLHQIKTRGRVQS